MAGSMKLQPDNGPRQSLGIGPSSDDAVGSCQKFARRFAEGIGKLAGNPKGDRREEDRMTFRKIAGGCRSMWEDHRGMARGAVTQSAALSGQCCWEKMLEQGRKTIEVLLRGKKKKLLREGRRGWSTDLDWDRMLNSVSNEGTGDGNDRGRERWQWRREEGSEDNIDGTAGSSVTKVH
ncbi:hypothetical protein B296_00055500 [Ensete ventricosum]|uniref:Uncharacterized protein n=1 Tax=Ensete ventricosum TaxID=4639 RepID=A0A426WZQ3_ENSVE|nr:hypothetical protein B296_00055500 [Ensete ventricosum]